MMPVINITSIKRSILNLCKTNIFMGVSISMQLTVKSDVKASKRILRLSDSSNYRKKSYTTPILFNTGMFNNMVEQYMSHHEDVTYGIAAYTILNTKFPNMLIKLNRHLDNIEHKPLDIKRIKIPTDKLATKLFILLDWLSNK